MPKLTKIANRYGRTDPNYRKASLLKINMRKVRCPFVKKLVTNLISCPTN